MKGRNVKERIFRIIQIGNKEDLPSRAFDYIISGVIILNILIIFLATFDRFSEYMPLFHGIDGAVTVFFLIEYILRLWTADRLYPEKTPAAARLRFLYSYDGIVDLLTILSFFYLSGFVAFRLLRVARIFHLFRINAQYDSFHVIVSVLLEKKNQIISSVFMILVLMFAGSLGMYGAEHTAQPRVFDNAFSGIWWAVSTVLTVGYGDIYPVTFVGKCLAILLAFLGVGVVAIPTGIISAGFVEHYQREQESGYKQFDLSDIMEFRIDGELADKPVSCLLGQKGLTIYLILRDDLTILPKETMLLKKDDIVVAGVRGDCGNA